MSNPNIQDIYSLTPLQKGMLFQSVANPNSTAYFVQNHFDIVGDLKVDIFEQSINILIGRHDIFRSVYSLSVPEQPLQVVLRERTLKLHVENIEDMGKDELERYLEEFLQEDRKQSFDLKRGPLMRISLLKTGSDVYHSVWSFHHILMDGWSLPLVLQEINHIYRRLMHKEQIHLPTSPSYGNYIEWLQEQDESKASNYWKDYLAGYDQAVQLPLGNLESDGAYEPENAMFSIGEEETNRLTELSKRLNVTLNTLFQTMWGIVLQKYNNCNDVVFGSVVSGRSAPIPNIEQMIGLFINTIPVRIANAGEDRFSDCVYANQKQALNSVQFEHYPLFEIQSQLDMRQGLVNHIMVFENYPATSLEAGNDSAPFKLENMNVHEQTSYDFNIMILPGTNIKILFRYNAKIHEKADVEQNYSHLLNIINQVLQDPEIRVKEIELTDAASREVLLKDTNKRTFVETEGMLIHQLFQVQAEQYPTNVALEYGDVRMTYSELNERSNRVANHLIKQGIGPESLVGVMLGRSPELIVAVLGVLKSGGAYVPIDPSYPTERREYMLRDSKVEFLITEEHLLENTNYQGKIIIAACFETLDEECVNPSTDCRTDSLAYVIYTSGSTGTPKGVLIEHRNVLNYISSFAEKIGVRSDDSILALTTVSFDLFVTEVLLPLTKGVKIVLAGDEVKNDANLLYNCLLKHRVTILQTTPSTIRMLMNMNVDFGELTEISKVLVGAEPFTEQLYTGLRNLPNADIYNVYGPTETTVWSTVKSMVSAASITVGEPLDNVHMIILDQFNKIQPTGVEGEICISGRGVGRGYLNNPELTSEKFIDHPYIPGEKLYRTGDLGKRLASGEFICMGRMDFQVKIRGHRIELGEIERNLLRFNGINECVAVAKYNQDVPYLVAYFTTDLSLNPKAIRNYLQGALPDHMVPSYFMELDQMPLTPNGKINRKALPDPDGIIQSLSAYEEPKDEIELKLVRIWESILKSSTSEGQQLTGRNEIGVADHFFELGGHSLKATSLVSRIQKEFNFSMPIKVVFERPTVKAQAEWIRGQHDRQELHTTISPAAQKDYYPVSSAQKRIYVLSMLEGMGQTYNMPGGAILEGDVDISRLEMALQSLVDRHEALRTSFETVLGEPMQRVGSTARILLEEWEVLDDENEEQALQRFIRPFNLNAAPLMRAGLASIGEKKLLLVDMHHIISDGVSLNIIMKELSALYNGEKVPELPIQYKDYSEWQHQLSQSDLLKKQRSYWLKAFEGSLPVLDLPTDYPRPAVQNYHGEQINYKLSLEMKERLKRLAADTDSTLYMVMLSAYSILLSKHSGQEDLVVGSPIAGRQNSDAEKVVGMFVNTLAMRNKPEGNKTFKEFLKEVKANALLAYEHQDYPFEELVDELNVGRDMSRNPLFDTMFVLQNMEKNQLHLEGISATPIKLLNNTAKFDLTLYAIEENDGIQVIFEYGTALFKRETIERMHLHYVNILQEILNKPDDSLCEIQMLSEVERKQILFEFNATEREYPQDKTIYELFEEQARKIPEHVAVVHDGREMTYRELDERSNQLARMLRKRGITKSSVVGILVNRSLELVIGILGIMKAGGAYLPINPTFPKERIVHMVEDSDVDIILTNTEHWGKDLLNRSLMIIDFEDESIEAEDYGKLEPASTAENTAYVIFTSGSTGRPKGVSITHRSLVNFIFGMESQYSARFSTEDRCLSLSNIVFDASVCELIMPIVLGSTLVLYPRPHMVELQTLARVLLEEKITFTFIPPTILGDLYSLLKKDSAKIPLNKLFVGAEPVKDYMLERFLELNPQMEIVNGYGPTETTICATVYKYETGKAHGGNIPIGKPMSNFKVFVLGMHDVLVPIGVPGELCVSGIGLSPGYLKRPELNYERFVDNPYLPGQKMYRTGDIVMWLNDGNIQYLGRADNQIKIRGYRIEPGEIERHLLSIEHIDEAMVLAQDDTDGNKYLSAYLVTQKDMETSSLRSLLLKHLPSYMIPSQFVFIESMPLTVNGKIDRKALMQHVPLKGKTNKEYVAPFTELEMKLSAIWKELLNAERVGITDQFFEIGGHSLKAIQLMNAIQVQMGIEVPLQVIFETPTIEGVSKFIEGRENLSSDKGHIVPLNSRGHKAVFCFPPMLGLGIVFKGIADLLQDEYTLYGLDFIEDDNRVMEYIQLITDVQPCSPYTFMGYSAGGNLAFKVAAAMEEQGYEVSRIIMLDSERMEHTVDDVQREIEGTVDQALNALDEHLFQFINDDSLNMYLSSSDLRSKIRQKMITYISYINSRVDDDRVQADIHLLRARQNASDCNETIKQVNSWSNSSSGKVMEYPAYGIHMEMLNDQHIYNNTEIIKIIMQETSLALKP